MRTLTWLSSVSLNIDWNCALCYVKWHNLRRLVTGSRPSVCHSALTAKDGDLRHSAPNA